MNITIIILAVILCIISLIITINLGLESGKLNPSTIKRVEFVFEKTASIVEIKSQPDITYNYQKVSGNYQYNIKINSMDLETERDVEVFPAILFKGKKIASEQRFELDGGKKEGMGDVEFYIESKIPPMSVVPTRSSCAQVMEDGEKFFIKNFVVELVTVNTIREPIRIIGFLPGYETKCKPRLHVTCFGEQQSFSLKLDKEDKSCDEQDEPEQCKFNKNMCGGEINLEFTRFEDHNADYCGNKDPLISINVVRFPDNFETGENMVISFWRVPTGEENQENLDCWKKDLFNLDSVCQEYLLSAYEVVILTDNLPSQVCA
ncbi:hypothetical protein ACFLQN_03520 [Candidatus Aenigmatarchaeota archaeon]